MNLTTMKAAPLAMALALGLGLGAGCVTPGPRTPATGAGHGGGSGADTADTTDTTDTGGGGTPREAGTAAPCAAAGEGTEGAGTAHPERAPLQAEASFAGGVRWAVCGADPVAEGALLDLRSTDDGATWTATDTGLSFSPHHAGDRVEVELTDATHGTIHLQSDVGELDQSYETVDGGATWRPAG